MGMFSDLRNTVFLRRISRNLSRIADALETQIALEHPHEAVIKTANVRRQPKLATITHPTVETWNTHHRDLHPPEDE